MSNTHRHFIQQGLLVAGTTAFVSDAAMAQAEHGAPAKDNQSYFSVPQEKTMTAQNSNRQPLSMPEQETSGSYSNSAITMIPSNGPLPASAADRALEARIARARLSGPKEITKDATVADRDEQGQIIVLRKGTNDWTCFPGNENQIGDVPMCADPMGMLWMNDLMAHKPKPTNTSPGLMYMLCGATQHSNTDPFDKPARLFPLVLIG